MRHRLSGSPKLKKEYTGYESFTGWYGRFVLEWLCPHCQTTKVKILKDDRYRSAQWIDGGPEARDQLGFWLCLDCSLEIPGRRMVSKVICREALAKPTWSRERTEVELAQHKRELFDESEGVLDV